MFIESALLTVAETVILVSVFAPRETASKRKVRRYVNGKPARR